MEMVQTMHNCCPLERRVVAGVRHASFERPRSSVLSDRSSIIAQGAQHVVCTGCKKKHSTTVELDDTQSTSTSYTKRPKNLCFVVVPDSSS